MTKGIKYDKLNKKWYCEITERKKILVEIIDAINVKAKPVFRKFGIKKV